MRRLDVVDDAGRLNNSQMQTARMLNDALHRWFADHRDWLRSAAMTIPQDFLDALEAIPAAKAFFQTLDRKNLYPIYYRLHTAKTP